MGASADGAPPSAPPPALDRALDLVRFLRGSCPWDGAQTPESLIPYLLEETHEVVDAIHEGDGRQLEGELGDLLLNLAFQVVLGEEAGRFDAESVTARLEDKMRRRHPHLYGLGEAEGWEALKSRERPEGESVLQGMAPGLDPLTAAHRIQDRVSGVGFDWADYRGAFDKVAEELEEVREALEEVGGAEAQGAGAGAQGGGAGAQGGGAGAQGGEAARGAGAEPVADRATGATAAAALDEELGDLLFAVVNLVRLAGSHPTTALARANLKFRRRFERLEALARERGIVLPEAGLEALDVLWDEVKREERGG